MRDRTGMPQPLMVMRNRQVYPRRSEPQVYRHDFHVIGLRVRGEGYYRVAGIEIPSGGRHFGLMLEGEEDVNGLVGPGESWWASFHWPGWAARARADGIDLPWSGRRVHVPRLKPVSAAVLAQLVDDFTALRAANARSDLGGALAARALLLGLLARFVDLPAAADGASVSALETFRRELERHACEEVRIDDLARASGASPDHLRELFLARFGQRPREYRDAFRLARARDLLADGASVRDAASGSGYGDPRYFARAFRRRFGLAPSEVRRRWRLG